MTSRNKMPAEVYNYMLRFAPQFQSEKLDLHHCLFSKGDVAGLPLEHRRKIHNPLNLLWIPAKDHASHANIPSRAEAYKILSERFGEEAVRLYVEDMLSLFKSKPFTMESLKGD